MCPKISGYRLLRDLNKIKLVMSTFEDKLFALKQVESKSNLLLTIWHFNGFKGFWVGWWSEFTFSH